MAAIPNTILLDVDVLISAPVLVPDDYSDTHALDSRSPPDKESDVPHEANQFTDLLTTGCLAKIAKVEFNMKQSSVSEEEIAATNLAHGKKSIRPSSSQEEIGVALVSNPEYKYTQLVELLVATCEAKKLEHEKNVKTESKAGEDEIRAASLAHDKKAIASSSALEENSVTLVS